MTPPRCTSGRRPSTVPPVGARSWWLEEALRADPGVPCPPLAGEVTADVCVVGGGFAGLWTAYELGERTPASTSSSSRPTSSAPAAAAPTAASSRPRGPRSRPCARRSARRAGWPTPPPSPRWSTSSTAGSRATRRASTPGTRGSSTPGPGSGSPGRTTRPSACSRSTATPTGCGAWTPPRRGASPTRRASSAA